MDVCLSWVFYMLSSRHLCDGPIPHPEEFSRLWCVLMCLGKLDLEVTEADEGT
jgi:hypothetical protein